METKKRKVILIIRDGWGYRDEKENNAIKEANTFHNDKLLQLYPNSLITTSGKSVGLPNGYQGNSEVGHMTIGSGRILFQPLARINLSIEDGSFFEIKEFIDAIENCKKNKSRLHLLGLIQIEGVHSHLDHLFALLELCKKQDFHDVYIHAITDGRDSPPDSGLKNIGLVTHKLKSLGFGKIATISGRYFTMDRDKRWDRTKIAYDCIVNGICKNKYNDPIEEMNKCYFIGQTDEFIVPRKMNSYDGIAPNDSVIFFNFRTDRTKQFTKAIVEDEFEGFVRKPLNVFYVGMTQFYNSKRFNVAFKDQNLSNLLGEVISQNNLRQLRISETEKFAHVTSFFNGQKEEAFINEERILIPSPKVATYDLKPEMSAIEITERLILEIKSNKFDFIVVNFANCDMVGHTGIKDAIIKAIKIVDSSVEKVVLTGLENDYEILVIADHGNAEDQTREWSTSHTINDVPLIFVTNDEELKKSKIMKGSGLVDIAPTILSLMGITIPGEMTGKNILENI